MKPLSIDELKALMASVPAGPVRIRMSPATFRSLKAQMKEPPAVASAWDAWHGLPVHVDASVATWECDWSDSTTQFPDEAERRPTAAGGGSADLTLAWVFGLSSPQAGHRRAVTSGPPRSSR